MTLYEPSSLHEAAQFLEDGARRALAGNDALAYGALTSALAVLAPAAQYVATQQEALAIRQNYQQQVEQIRLAAAELGLGLMCMCPDCEAAREGREDPECDCDDCRRMRGEEVEGEDDD